MKKLLFILLISSLYSCRSVETITEIEYRDRYITNTLLDSVFLYKQDSIVIVQRGDTIFKDRWKTVVKEHIVMQTDTCFVEIEKISTQVIEKKETKLNKFLKYAGGVFLSLLFIILLYFAVRFLKR